MKQLRKQRGTSFEQVPIEFVKKVLEQQAPPARSQPTNPMAVAGPLAAKHKLPAALRGKAHRPMRKAPPPARHPRARNGHK